MKSGDHLAIIGSGPSAVFLLKHLLDAPVPRPGRFRAVSIFEKLPLTGTGMPYSPLTTDRFNLSNISSEEIPALPETFADWLRGRPSEELEELGVPSGPIDDRGIYSRLALGRYLRAQYRILLDGLSGEGIEIHEYPGCEITDVRVSPVDGRLSLHTAQGAVHVADRVVIATGHCWPGEDEPRRGYFASPWPISKLLPEEGTFHNFAIGTLGASLSAFDVIASLSHRHGTFVEAEGRMTYQPHPGTEDFKIIMHSFQGLLPHLQFDQVEPFREIYRHVGREELLGMMERHGFLRLETYFDRVCRPVLREAFRKDGMAEIAEVLEDPSVGLERFIEVMTDEHEYDDAFEGMRLEMREARDSIERRRPIHWKETLDDLLYTLNFHAEYLPAEDHLLLRSLLLPFAMNVAAAMPLRSARTILALHDAGKLSMIAGKATVEALRTDSRTTTVRVENEGEEAKFSYRMFVDCSGQKPVEMEDHAFQSLVKDGSVRRARARFISPARAGEMSGVKTGALVPDDSGQPALATGGIQIDAAYRVIGCDGNPNPRLHDIAIPHTSGTRPYSYGLQACNEAAALVVHSWADEAGAGEGAS